MREINFTTPVEVVWDEYVDMRRRGDEEERVELSERGVERSEFWDYFEVFSQISKGMKLGLEEVGIAREAVEEFLQTEGSDEFTYMTTVWLRLNREYGFVDDNRLVEHWLDGISKDLDCFSFAHKIRSWWLFMKEEDVELPDGLRERGGKLIETAIGELRHEVNRNRRDFFEKVDSQEIGRMSRFVRTVKRNKLGEVEDLDGFLLNALVENDLVDLDGYEIGHLLDYYLESDEVSMRAKRAKLQMVERQVYRLGSGLGGWDTVLEKIVDVYLQWGEHDKARDIWERIEGGVNMNHAFTALVEYGLKEGVEMPDWEEFKEQKIGWVEEEVVERMIERWRGDYLRHYFLGALWASKTSGEFCMGGETMEQVFEEGAHLVKLEIERLVEMVQEYPTEKEFRKMVMREVREMMLDYNDGEMDDMDSQGFMGAMMKLVE